MLFGHLARMNELADSRKILTAVFQSDWKMSAWRLHSAHFLDGPLKNDLSYHNLSVEDATELALDRPLRGLLAAIGDMHWIGASWTIMMMMQYEIILWSTAPLIWLLGEQQKHLLLWYCYVVYAASVKWTRLLLHDCWICYARFLCGTLKLVSCVEGNDIGGWDCL